ncbi:MAG: alanine racemase [Acidobacteria bacterium]|nr:alanine racemase [Acidobacteriota bacterium]
MDPTTWVEVSLGALEGNLRAAREHAGVPVCAVVKANAYGHGLVPVAETFARAGAAMLAVTRIEEARTLRDSGVDAPLLLLTPPPDPAAAVKLGCAFAVCAVEEIERLPRNARAHLKVDTGMGRFGVRPEEAVEAARRIAEHATLEAVWTHFAGAAGPDGPRQLARFVAVREAVRDASIKCLFHAANSAAMLALPGARLDLVRIGTLLYGQNPPGAHVPFPLRDTFGWLARAVSVRRLPAGAAVGYGGEWRAPRPTRVATLPVGYADGFGVEPLARTETLRGALRLGGRAAAVALGRRESGRAVFFGSRRAPVVGRIAMQAVTVSLEGLDEVAVGAVARIPARRLLVSASIERVYS